MPKKDYKNWDRNELISEIEQLRKRKKYGLVWEDKPEDVVEQCKNELPVLEEVVRKEIITDSKSPVNLLIEGDNYHALSVLNYTHKGKVDVIYIDPPYNTGARDWKYNNDYVDGEDPYRHTKWISFMAHRLKIAKNVLAPDGIICVTIDDYEMPRLWMLMEDIFGEFNHLGSVVIRNNPKGRMTKRKFSLVHEYAVFFGKTKNSSIKKLPVDPSEKSHNYKKDDDGSWYLPVNLRKQGVDSNAINKKGNMSKRHYPIYFDPKTGQISSEKKLPIEILPIDSKNEKRIWRRGKEVIDEMYESGDLSVKETKYGYQIYFKFRGGLDGRLAQSIWYDSKFSASEYGTRTLDAILGKREMFQYPKAPEAVKESILASSNKKDAIVLDFFAGSGTTGQAVLELNREDNGNRKFIICTNNENGIAEDVCYPRVKRVMEGYSDVEGLGGNLKYYKTEFVPAALTDKNKTLLTKKTIQMLCIKEDTFEKVKSDKKYCIYRKGDQYTGIIFDHLAISDFKKQIAKIDGKFSLYIFSLGDDTFDEEFEDMKKKVKLSPIPEAILRVYRRIFK